MGFDFSTADVNSGEMKVAVKWETRDEPPTVTGELSIAGFKLFADANKGITQSSIRDDTGIFCLTVREDCSEDLASGWLLLVDFKKKTESLDFTSGWRRVTLAEGEEDDIVAHCNHRHCPHEPENNVIHQRADKDFTLTLQVTAVARNVFTYSAFVDKNISSNHFRANCKIVLEDDDNEELFVNKENLATYSKFFEKLFFGEFAEKDKDSIAIREVTKDDMLEFLWCLQLPPRPVESWEIETVLELADRFDCQHLIHQIEDYFANMTFSSFGQRSSSEASSSSSVEDPDEDTLVNYLLLADRYRMYHAFKKLWKIDKISRYRLLHPDMFYQLSQKTKDMLLLSASTTLVSH